MTNEIIAKDLTVAIVNKMTNPTPDSVSEIYHAILQKFTDPQQVIIFQTIQDHLTKQDDNSILYMRDTSIAFAGSIFLAGLTLVVTSRTLQEGVAIQLLSSGAGIAIIGIVMAIIFYIISMKWREKKN